MAGDSRIESIHALDAFIATQHLLLARQKDDIERLQRLRSDLHERPSAVLPNLSDKSGYGTFRLSAQTDLRLIFPQKIDWSAFDKADTTSFSTFVSRLHRKRVLPQTQQTPLSDLQVLVKTAKSEILDPILEMVAKSTTFLHVDSEEEDLDPLERSRFDEQRVISELKRRKVRGRGSGLSLLTTRNVVFVRNDLEDETGEVDIDSWANERNDANLNPDTPSQSVTEWPPKTAKPSLKVNERRRKSMCKTSEERSKTKAKLLPFAKSRSHSKVTNCSSDVLSPSDDDGLTKIDGHTDVDMPAHHSKSETYKQAWSIDEQNLLEQLLETIPVGEKYRWLKISRAMGGRRTPRQVASRVQKYFEKLKKFGVTLD